MTALSTTPQTPVAGEIGVIGINLLWLRPGKVGGSERMAVAALGALAEQSPERRVGFRLFVNRQTLAAYKPLILQFPHDVAPIGTRFRPIRVAVESTWMNFRARRAGVNAMLHLGGTLPKHSLRGARQTVLIHDLQPVQVGDNFSPIKRWYLRWALGRAVRNADRVIVPSQDVRTQIAHVYGTAAAERVRVVYHGTPTAQEVAGEVRPVPQVDGERFLLFPAAHWAHKGHRDFIDVMAQLPELHLALAGGETEHTGDIRARIDQAGLGDRIHVLGRVDEPELRWLYRNAEAVVLPSEYEGFGLPVVEAAAYGTAPLVSDITVFDEFLPVGAPRLRRNNTKSWPQTIRTVIDDPGYASRLAADVLSKNSALTWKATVDGWVRAVTDR